MEHSQDVDLTLKISDFWVRQISEETNEINIEQESSDINLTVELSASF